ncbi:MAG: hypothetical protein Q9184_006893 [Pyrenodesmia sp. 2 TL-2023]
MITMTYTFVPVETLSSVVVHAIVSPPNNANNELGQELSKGAKIADIAEFYNKAKDLCANKCLSLKGRVFHNFKIHKDFYRPLLVGPVRVYCAAPDASRTLAGHITLDRNRCASKFVRLLSNPGCKGDKPECKEGQNSGGQLIEGEISYCVYPEIMAKWRRLKRPRA